MASDAADDVDTSQWGPLEAARCAAANVRACREALDGENRISALDSTLVVGSMISTMNSVRGVLVSLTSRLDDDSDGVVRARTVALQQLDELVGRLAEVRRELARVADGEPTASRSER